MEVNADNLVTQTIDDRKGLVPLTGFFRIIAPLLRTGT